MRIVLRVVLQAFALLLLSVVHGHAAETSSVGHNPFARPARVSEPTSAQSSAMGAPMFGLRATMAAGVDSLVNIDGEILRLGDVLAGYRLVAVGEGTAVFVRNGVRYPIAIGQTSGDQG